MNQPEKSGRLILTFSQDGTVYGVFARYIKEIMALPELTQIPGKREELRGLFSYKGAIVPVLSFSRLCRQTSEENTCLVLQEDGGAMVGLSIASVNDLITGNAVTLHCAQSEINRGMLKFDSILEGDIPVMVLDITGTFGVGHTKGVG